MRCPYCQQNIRVQGRFCPKCGEQIFGLPVQQQPRPPAGASTPLPPQPQAPPAPPPTYRPFGGGAAPTQPDDDLIGIETEPPPASPASGGATGLHAAAGDDVGKTCPYCRFPLKPSEQVMTCPACKLPHHADCWRENQGCTTYGCRGTAAATSAGGSVPPVIRPTSVGPAPTHMGLPDFGSLQQTELTGRANNALILAVVGMLCCAPLALIGLFMGISILSDIRRTNVQAPQASGKAVAAIALGVLGTLGWLIYLLSMAGRQSG